MKNYFDQAGMPESDETQASSRIGTWVQAGSAMFLAAVAVFKPEPGVSGILGIAFLLFLATIVYRPVRKIFRKARDFYRQWQSARSLSKELPRLIENFKEFADPASGRNLRERIRSRIFDSNSSEMEKYSGPDFFGDFMLRSDSRLDTSKRGRSHFCRVTKEFIFLVQSYNKHFVVRMFRALKKPGVADKIRAEYLEELDIIRDEWVDYQRDLKRFLKRANQSWGEDFFRCYLEPPPKLQAQ